MLSATAQANENQPDSTSPEYHAPEITVSEKKGDLLQNITGKTSVLLNPSRMSVYKVINMMPSVSQQSVDPYGLADIVNYHEATITLDTKRDAARAEEHPKVFAAIHICDKLCSPDCNQAELDKAAGLSMDKYCSIPAMLKASGCEVTWEAEVVAG